MLGPYSSFFKHIITNLKEIKMIFPVTYASVAFLLVPTLAFPANLISDFKLDTPPKNFEIVEGPKEFFVPLVPLRDIVVPRKTAKDSMQIAASTATDLDYIVYGKLYLMKSMDIADRDFEPRSESVEKPRLHSDASDILHENPSSKLSYNDGISFPASSNPVKRPYRYKTWSKLLPLNEDLDNVNDVDMEFTERVPLMGRKSGHSDHRKLEERSADQIDIPEKPVALSTSTNAGVTNLNENDKANDSLGLDEEALELLQKLLPQSAPAKENTDLKIETDGEKQGNDTASNSTADNIDIGEFGDRFLINVPTKPNLMQCPEGQKRTRHGTCKPVFVHKPSPNDGFFGGRIYAAANGSQRPQRTEQSSPSIQGRRRDEIPNLQWTTLFRSVAQLEKQLEKVIKGTEAQLSALVQEDHNASTIATDKTAKAV